MKVVLVWQLLSVRCIPEENAKLVGCQHGSMLPA